MKWIDREQGPDYKKKKNRNEAEKNLDYGRQNSKFTTGQAYIF